MFVSQNYPTTLIHFDLAVSDCLRRVRVAEGVMQLRFGGDRRRQTRVKFNVKYVEMQILLGYLSLCIRTRFLILAYNCAKCVLV
jgi:hypothetical protein